MFRPLVLAAILAAFVSFTVGDTVSGDVLLNGDPSLNTSVPSGSILQVDVSDTSIADAMARVLGTSQTSISGSFPFSYSVIYTPDNPPRPFYTVSAQITNGNTLLYRNTQSITTTVQEDGTDEVDIPVNAMR